MHDAEVARERLVQCETASRLAREETDHLLKQGYSRKGETMREAVAVLDGCEAEERRDGSGRDGGRRLPLGQGLRACLRLRDPADGAGDEQRRGAQRTKHRTDPSSQLEILEAGARDEQLQE